MAGKLKINPNVTISGLLDFQGDDYVQFSEDSSVTGNRTIKFNIWLDQDSGYSAGSGIISLGDISNDHIVASLEGSNMYFYTSTSGGGTRNRYCSITGFDNQVLLVEITKSEESIDSVTFNGASQSLTNNILSKNTGGNDYVGRDVAGYLSNATVWNVEVVGEFKVLGYPGGNLDSAWEDQIGTSDGDVFGSPGTRNIIGIQSGSVASMTKRLKIDQIIPPGGIFELNKKLLLKGTFIEQPFLTFVTEASSGADAFDPVIASSSGLANWDLGDGSILTGTNSFSHDYADGTPKTVKLYNGTIPGIESIDSINMYEDNLVGPLDLSEFNTLNTLSLSNNPKIAGVILPSHNLEWQSVYVYSCGLTGTLDVSGMTGWPTVFRGDNNPNLTNILFPTDVSTTTAHFYLNSTGISSLDLRGFHNLGGLVYLQSNASLTEVLFPDSSQSVDIQISTGGITGTLDVSSMTGMYSLVANSCPNLNQILCPSLNLPMTQLQSYGNSPGGLTGTLDLRPYGSNFGAYFRVDTNPNLTEILNPVSSRAITKYNAVSCDLTGILDVSGLTGLGGSFNVGANTNLTQILNPTSSQNFTEYAAYSCNLTGTLDVSGLTGLGGVFNVGNNDNLNYILHSASSINFAQYNVTSSGLMGTLDLSGLSGLGGSFNIQYNPSLNTIENPTSSRPFSSYFASFCDLTGTLDVSGLTGLGGSFSVQGNDNLTSILFPSSGTFTGMYIDNCNLTGAMDLSNLNISNIFQINENPNLTSLILNDFINDFLRIYANDCSLNQASVDGVFAKLNTYYTSNEPTRGLTVNIQDGTNMPPTDGSSNSDILNLESIFSGAGQTLTITINE